MNYSYFYETKNIIRNIIKKIHNVCADLGLNAREVSLVDWTLEHDYYSNFVEILNINQMKNSINSLGFLNFSGSAEIIADEENDPTEYLEKLRDYIVSILKAITNFSEYAFPYNSSIKNSLSGVAQVVENGFDDLIFPIKEKFQNYIAEKYPEDYSELEVTAGLFQKLAEQNIYFSFSFDEES